MNLPDNVLRSIMQLQEAVSRNRQTCRVSVEFNYRGGVVRSVRVRGPEYLFALASSSSG